MNSVFASKSITEHLLRGAFGVGMFYLSFHTAKHGGPLVFIPLAFIAWRGCPTCWLTGLFYTVRRRLQGW